MPDAERPAGSDKAGVGRRGARRRRSVLVPGLGDLARRLTALEREVEEALEGRAAPDTGDRSLRTRFEQAVAGYARVRRSMLAGDATREIGEAVLRGLYQYWWRVEAHGFDQVPSHGRVMVVTNRSGALLPYDALMVALGIERSTGRYPRPLVDEWLAALPVLGPALGALGALAATPANLRDLLDRDEAAILFPEGHAAAGKPFRQRYRLRPFGGSNLLGVAIETGTPIVPVAVIGAEEVQPVLFRVPLVGRPFGVPAVPVTPTLVPLPTRWTIYAGEPLDVSSCCAPGRTRDARAVRRLRDQVRERLQGLVTEGRRRRRSIFFA
jgi:1-acyl-sn-glycerol-3-phosphate acyltransferase